MKKIYTVAIIIIITGFTSIAFSQTGVLDASFGNGGKVITSVGDSSVDAEQLSSLVIQPDGKILAAGMCLQAGTYPYAIVRYKTNGTLDSAFGTNGKVITLVDTPDNTNPVTVILQPDGKILLTGYGKIFVLIRYNSNGTLDNSFGVNGIVTKDFPLSWSRSTSVVLRSDGKILISGIIDSSGSSIVAMRFSTTGSIDSSFGKNGLASFQASSADIVTRIVLQPDNKVLVGTSVSAATSTFNDFTIVRFNEDGIVDSSFGTGGVVYIDFAGSYDNLYAMSLQSDNKILLSGAAEVNSVSKMGLARLNPDGTLDATFGTAGKLITSISNQTDLAFSIFEQPDSKIIVAGVADLDDNITSTVSTGKFALLRYKSDGSLDSAFGKRGVIKTTISGASLGLTSLRQNDGKILIGGIANYGVRTQFALARYEENALEYYNTLTGSVFLDANANAMKDANEPYVNNAEIVTAKQGTDTIISAAYNGRFLADLDTGTYVSHVVLHTAYHTVVPATHTTLNTNYFNTDSVVFALQPIPGKRDVAVYMIPLGVARPGFYVSYRIFYRNNGTDTVNGALLEFAKSSKLNFITSIPAATTINGDTLQWTVFNLKPLDTASIVVNFSIQAPPVFSIGDTLSSVATIYTAGELTPQDNTSVIKQIAVGSFDPNDKAELHAGRITKTQVTAGEYLTYTIRFQNTGTDTAFNIYVRDTMDAKLDLSTFEMITASANYQLTMNDGKCVWTFSNINLADMVRNEPASHGYLVYRVKAKNTVQVGDIITNSAAIYFDYNLPVQTNTETTNIVAESLPLKLLSFAAKNESTANHLKWSTNNEVNVAAFEIERSADGREYNGIGNVRAGLNSYSFIDNNPLIAMNFYRLKMMDKDGKFEYSPVRIVDNSSSFQVSIYPNPVKDKLQVKMESVQQNAVQVHILSQDGKVLMNSSWKMQQGNTLKSINVSGLKNGSYYFQMITENKEHAMMKFEVVK